MATMFPNGVPLPEPKPDRSAQQAGTPLPNAGTDLRSGWQEFLSHPENRAGLLQFGVSMLAAPQGNTLAQNIGGALGEGLQARGDTINAQAATESATQKAEREDALANSLIGYRQALSVKARRPPVGKAGSTAGTFTPKDRTKEWLKFVKDRRVEEPDAKIADLKSEFDEVMAVAEPGAAAAPSVAPAAGGVNAAAINQMTLEQLKALDVNTLEPGTAATVLARYRALKGSK